MFILRSEVFVREENILLSFAAPVRGQFSLLLPSIILGLRGCNTLELSLLTEETHMA